MKKIIIFLMAVLLVVACSSDPLGQTPTNGNIPPMVSNPIIKNMPGGAMIYFTLPDNETDLSYIKAEYMYKGAPKVTKSSVYKNFVLIEGFGSTDPVEVKLYTVNHSEVASDPLTVTINPETPSIYSITQSFSYIPDFGGFNLKWENETKGEIILTVLVYDEKAGSYLEEDALYTSSKTGNFSFRGFESIPTKFGVFVRDKFNNYSDTVKFELTPIYETQIKTDNFARVRDIPADCFSDLTNAPQKWRFELLWDGIVGRDNGWHTRGNEKVPLYFTIDLGQNVKLSRFKLYQRLKDFIYSHGNPKKFQLWGASEYEKKDNTYYMKGGPWETDGHWQFMGSFEIIKPSGEGPITSEDIEAAERGHEFTVSPELKPVRYLRFGILESFSGSKDTHMSELIFWGNDKVDQ